MAYIGNCTVTLSMDAADSVRWRLVDGKALAIVGLYIFGSLTILTKNDRL